MFMIGEHFKSILYLFFRERETRLSTRESMTYHQLVGSSRTSTSWTTSNDYTGEIEAIIILMKSAELEHGMSSANWLHWRNKRVMRNTLQNSKCNARYSLHTQNIWNICSPQFLLDLPICLKWYLWSREAWGICHIFWFSTPVLRSRN